MLGIFGRDGVHAAAYWPLQDDNPFAYAAFAMFRNYDGQGAAFGDTAVRATTSDVETSSVYARVRLGRPARVVIVAINKATSPQTARLTLRGGPQAGQARVYALTADEAKPVAGPELKFAEGAFAYELPAQSVSVIVPRGAGTPGGGDGGDGGDGGGGGGDAGGDGPTGEPGGGLRLAQVLRVPPRERCLGRLRMRVRRAYRSQVGSVRVKPGRRRARVFRGAQLRRRFAVRRLPARARFRVRFTVRMKDGTTVKGKRRYRRCRPPR